MVGPLASADSGTWCEREWSSVLRPSTSFGPVQPFGVRSTISGQRGRCAWPLARASAWISAISSSAVSSVSAISRWITAGSEPSTKYGFQP